MTVTPISSYLQFSSTLGSGVDAKAASKPAKRVVVIDFWAAWCGPCRVISPQFEKWSTEDSYKDVGFFKVDVDAVPEIAQEVGIKAMPTFILFVDGNKMAEVIGANPPRISELLKQAAEFAKGM